MSETKRMEIMIGAFVLASVVVVGALIILLGDMFNPFRETYTVVAEFDKIGALQRGAPVKLGGYEIGRVSKITPPEAGKLEVWCNIDEEVTMYQGTYARTATEGIVGDTFVEFTRGDVGHPLPKNRPKDDPLVVEGRGSVSTDELFIKVSEIGDEVQILMEGINEVLDPEFKRNIDDTVRHMARTTAAAEELVNDLRRTSENIYAASEDIRETATTVRQVSEDVRTAVDETVKNEENIRNLEETLANLRNTSEKADRIAGRVDGILARGDRLFTDQEPRIRQTMQNVEAITGDLRTKLAAIDTEEGVLRYFTTDELNDQIDETLARIDGLAKNLNALFAGTTKLEILMRYVQGSHLARQRQQELVRMGFTSTSEVLEEEYREQRRRLEKRGFTPEGEPAAPGDEGDSAESAAAAGR